MGLSEHTIGSAYVYARIESYRRGDKNVRRDGGLGVAAGNVDKGDGMGCLPREAEMVMDGYLSRCLDEAAGVQCIEKVMDDVSASLGLLMSSMLG